MSFPFGDPVNQYTTPFLLALWTQIGGRPDSDPPIVNLTGSRRGGHCLEFPGDTSTGRGSCLLKTIVSATPTQVSIAGAIQYVPSGILPASGFDVLITPAAGANSLNVVNANAGTNDVTVNQFCSVRKDYYTHVALSVNANGTITAYRGDAQSFASPFTGQDRISGTYGATTNALTFLAYHFYELIVTIHPSAGSIVLNIDEDEWLNLTGINTVAQDGDDEWDNIMVGFPRCTGGTLSIYMHDIRVLDGDTSNQDDDLVAPQGDLSLVAVPPDQDGAMTDWTPLNGGTHFSEVDEIPPDDDITYNSSVTPGDIDSFIIPGVPIANATVVAYGVMADIRKVDSGPSATQMGIRIGGVNFPIGISRGNTSTYTYQQAFVNNKPSDHAPFSIPQAKAAEPEYEKTA